MEFLKVLYVVAASIITAKAGHLGGGSSYAAPSSGGAGISSSYGVPSFADGGGISSSYNIPSSSYGVPSTGGGYNSHGSSYDGHSGGHHDHSEPAKPYEFGYAVKDPHSGSDFKQQETSDGNTVKGQYKVLLPDGRIQIVTYTADWKTGFHADVKYEGEAVYPQHYGNGGHGGYSSGPSSSYGVPSAGGYSGGAGDFGHGGGAATGSAYNNIGYGGSSGGGHNDYSGHQQYGVPGY